MDNKLTTPLSRRQLGKLLLAGSSLCLMPENLWASDHPPLPIPPLLSNKRGRPIYLYAESTQYPLSHRPVSVWGFNGHYLGATIQLKQGDFAKFHWKNCLKEKIAINIQGLEAEGELYGGFSRPLLPEQSWSPILPITQPASTCLYQACTWKKSAYQTYRGLVGLCIIDDPATHKTLPHQYGVNDIPLILQDMQLNKEGEQLFQVNEHHFLGNRLFVNGRENPYLNVSSEVIRLRLANASISRTYHLHFEDDRPFELIALDHGFLPKNVTLHTLSLAPSERAEILVDLSNGGNACLLAGEKLSLFHRLSQFFQPNTLQNNVVLTLRTSGLASAFGGISPLQFESDIPRTLTKKIKRVRHIHINTENATLNSEHFDPQRLDILAKQGTVEQWVIQTNKPTTFRIQGAKFLVEMAQNIPTPPSLMGWKDSIYIENTVTLRVTFPKRSSNKFPFIFGSADLALADAGCMGILVVE